MTILPSSHPHRRHHHLLLRRRRYRRLHRQPQLHLRPLSVLPPDPARHRRPRPPHRLPHEEVQRSKAACPVMHDSS